MLAVFSPVRAKAALYNEYTLATDNVWKSGSISNSDGINYYKVRLTSAGFLHIDYEGRSIRDAYVEVWNAEQTGRFYQKNVYYSSDSEPIVHGMDFTLEAGNYVIKVYPHRGNAGTYRVRAKFISAKSNEKEPNNALTQAMQVYTNTTIKGLLSQTDQRDIYCITVPRSQKITITVVSRAARIQCILNKADGGNIFSERYDGSETFPKTGSRAVELTAVTYYIYFVAYYTNTTGRYEFTVTGITPSPVNKVSSLSISGNKAVAVGGTLSLRAAVRPTNAKNKSVTWTSSNTKVATVSSTGKVTARYPGKAVITAKAKDGSGKTAKCTVIVRPKRVAVSQLISPSKGKLKAIWAKQAGISGYQVEYSPSSSFTSGRFILLSSSKNTYTGGATSNKVYYVRIRAYKKIDGKTYYGSWSTAKKVKVK